MDTRANHLLSLVLRGFEEGREQDLRCSMSPTIAFRAGTILFPLSTNIFFAYFGLQEYSFFLQKSINNCNSLSSTACSSLPFPCSVSCSSVSCCSIWLRIAFNRPAISIRSIVIPSAAPSNSSFVGFEGEAAQLVRFVFELHLCESVSVMKGKGTYH